MINLHIYPSPLTNESRIERETRFVARELGLEVEVAGIAKAGLPAIEPRGERILFRRFPRSRMPAGFGAISKAANHVEWMARVYAHYRNAPLRIINCHSLPVLPLCVALKKATGAALIYDAHELETETIALGGVRKKVSKLLERTLIGQADQIIVVGDAIRDWYVREYDLDNVSVVLNCPEFQSTTGEAAFELKRAFNIADDQPLFLYLGLLGPGRGIELALQAFAGFDGAHVAFIGYGSLEPAVRAAAIANPNIHFHPAVPPAQVQAITRQADVGLSLIEPIALSYFYCMPNKVFEYINAGVPLLVSNTPEQAALVRTNHIGDVADPLTVDGVIAAVRRMVSQPLQGYRDRIASIRGDFDWHHQEDRLRQVYGKLG